MEKGTAGTSKNTLAQQGVILLLGISLFAQPPMPPVVAAPPPKLGTNIISGSYTVTWTTWSNGPNWTPTRAITDPSAPQWLINVYGMGNPLWLGVEFVWPVGQKQWSPPEEYDFTLTVNHNRKTYHLYATNAVNGTNHFVAEIVHVPTNVYTITSVSHTMSVSSNLESGPWLLVATNYVRLTNPLGKGYYQGTNVHIVPTNY